MTIKHTHTRAHTHAHTVIVLRGVVDKAAGRGGAVGAPIGNTVASSVLLVPGLVHVVLDDLLLAAEPGRKGKLNKKMGNCLMSNLDGIGE